MSVAKVMNTVGRFIARLLRWYVGMPSYIGVALAIPLYVLLPSVGVMAIGASFASGAAGSPLWPSPIVYGVQSGLLSVMVISLWASRARSQRTSIPAALLYVAAGVLFIAVEATTSASMTMGIWPTWGEDPLDLLKFVWKLWSTLTGWTMIVWLYSALFAMAVALQSPQERDRAVIQPVVDAADAARRISRVTRPVRRLDDMAGMAGLKRDLREFAAHFKDYGRMTAAISDINGLLLGGPPGNGKTAFAEALATELGFGFLKVGVSDLGSVWVNESAVKIGEVFAEAAANAPCVLFLDEIDAIARERGRMNSHAEDMKATNALLQEIDNARKKRIVIVAASNHVESLDPAFARPGRFDVKIDVPVPDLEARKGILKGLLAREGLRAEDAVVDPVAQVWERRSAAFIESTVKRLRERLKRERRADVTVADLKAAAREASRREGAIPKSGTPLSKLVLPQSVRRDAESIVYRLKNWEALAERGGSPPSGVLLYGPPGTGKTNIVRAIALELGDWHVFEVKVAEMLADARSFEKVLAQAAEHRPAIIFLDEADDILRDRSYSPNAAATNEILKAMDGMMGAVPEVVFFAATNNPDAIDAAAKRGGRFTEKILMDLLEGDDLSQLARNELDRRSAAKFDENVTPQWIASALGPIGPADLVAVVSKAINSTLSTVEPRPVGRDDVLAAYVAILDRQPPGMP